LRKAESYCTLVRRRMSVWRADMAMASRAGQMTVEGFDKYLEAVSEW